MNRIAAFVLIACIIAIAQQQQPVQSSVDRPRVSNMDVPFYSPLARAARISGSVELAITTDGERVSDVRVLKGHKLLADAAEKNIRSWKFYPHTRTQFTVEYTFKFAKSDAKNFSTLVRMFPDSEVRTELPMKVEVTSAPWPN